MHQDAGGGGFRGTLFIGMCIHSVAPPTGNKEKYGWLARLLLSVPNSARVLSPTHTKFALNKRRCNIEMHKYPSIMDILKELFGTSDELQINKSLFGSEVGHVESLNMGLGELRQ